MRNKKYPLFSPTLMQVNSFAFCAPSYQHPFRDEWTVRAIGHALNEQDTTETHQNYFVNQFEEFMKAGEWNNGD